mgnify:CR=1 FL=1
MLFRSKIVLRYAEAVDKLQILNENLANRLKECADDLEAEINARYANTQDTYPSEKRRYDRDMQKVIDARVWIEKSKKKSSFKIIRKWKPKNKRHFYHKF